MDFEAIFYNIRCRKCYSVFLGLFIAVILLSLMTFSWYRYFLCSCLLLLVGFAFISYLHPQLLLYLLVMALYSPVLPGLRIIHNRFVEYSFISQSQQVFPSDLIILLLTIITVLKRGVLLKGILHKSNMEHFGLLYLLLGVLAIVVGWFKGNPNLFFDFRLYFYFLLAVCFPIIINDTKELYNIIKFIVIVNGVVVVYAFIDGYVLSEAQFGCHYLNIDRFMNLFCILILFSLFFHKNKDLSQKIAVFIMCPLFILILLIDNTRSIYLGLIIGLILILLITFKQILKKGYVIGFFSMVLIFMTLMVVTNSSDILSKSYARIMTISKMEEDPSILYRLNAIKAGINEFMKSPIVGTGTGKEIKFFIPIEAGSKSLGAGGYTYGTLHNFHLKTLLIGGLIAYLFFIYIILSLLRKCWLTYKKEDGLLKTFSLGFFSGFLSYITIIFVTVFTISTFIMIWLFAGLILATHNINFRKSLI